MEPDGPLPSLTYRDQSVADAEKLFQEVRQQQRSLVDTLPTNYEFLRQLHSAT